MHDTQTPTIDAQTVHGQLLRATDVARLLSVSVRTVWRLRDSGELPRPVRIPRNLICWRKADVEKYVRDGLANG